MMATEQGVHEENSAATNGININIEELRSSLHALNLTFIIYGEYMVVMEADINIILSGEPYVAFMLLFNVRKGNYFARIWNQTVVSGKAINVYEISSACDKFFYQGKPCLGCPIDDMQDYGSDEFVIMHSPIKRKYSRACHKVLQGQVVSSENNTCSECLMLMNIKSEIDDENSENSIEPKNEDDRKVGEDKPNLTYPQIIKEALLQADNNMLSIRKIFRYIEEKYPYFNHNVPGWQKRIRTTLSEHAIFQSIYPSNKVVKGGRVWSLCSNTISGNNADTPSSRTSTDPLFLFGEKPLKVEEKYNEEHDEIDQQDLLRPYQSCYEKPSQSFCQLITEAFSQAKDKKQLSFGEICSFISHKHPYYAMEGKGWQQQIKRSLYNAHHFTKMDNNDSEDSSRWVLAPDKGNHGEGKPRRKYHRIIADALMQAEGNQLSLHEIFKYIEDNYPYYRSCNPSWQSSISCTLSRYPYFKKVSGEKGGLWTICKESHKKFNREGEKKQHEKPPFTFAEMISQAFDHSGSKLMSRIEICTFINKTYPYYRGTVTHKAVFESLKKSSIIKNIGFKDKCSLWKLVDGTEVECLKCNRLFQCEDEEYYNHMRDKHFFGKFTCPSGCNIKAEYAKDLVDHMQQEEHREEQFAECPLCQELIPIRELESHYATCVSASLRKPVVKQICPTCGIQVAKKSFDVHMKSHASQPGPGEEKSKATLQHYCDQCEKCYASRGALNDHIKAEHKGILIKCQLCPEKFKSRGELWQHKNLLHSTDQRYSCKYCGARYGSESYLRTHMRTHEEPQFACKHCGKKMTHKNSLIKHERIHTGEKPFLCTVDNCGKRWIDNSALLRHKKQVHKIYGGKMRQCQGNGKAMARHPSNKLS